MQTAETTPKQSKPRHRSPNYPAVGLRESVERVRKLYDADKRAGSRLESAVKHLGFSSAHGTAMTMISALRKFGLIEDSTGGRIVASDLAVTIIAYPEADQRRRGALSKAALKPDIYRKLFDRYLEAGQLPSDETLKAELEAEMNFNPSAVTSFVKDFKDSLIYAGLLDPTELTLAKEAAIEELATQDRSRQAPAAQPRNIHSAPKPKVDAPKSYSWALSPSATAELRITGEISPEDLEMLRDYVEITIKALGRSVKKEDGAATQ